ncbi:hypothetical protein D3C72_825800 [compost metagenome]
MRVARQTVASQRLNLKAGGRVVRLGGQARGHLGRREQHVDQLIQMRIGIQAQALSR